MRFAILKSSIKQAIQKSEEINVGRHGDYELLSEALATINDASADFPYLIKGTGILNEPLKINWKSYVNLLGIGKFEICCQQPAVQYNRHGALDARGCSDFRWENFAVRFQGVNDFSNYYCDQPSIYLEKCTNVLMKGITGINEKTASVASSKYLFSPMGFYIYNSNNINMEDCVGRSSLSPYSYYAHGIFVVGGYDTYMDADYQPAHRIEMRRCRGYGGSGVSQGNINTACGINIYTSIHAELYNCEGYGGDVPFGTGLVLAGGEGIVKGGRFLGGNASNGIGVDIHGGSAFSIEDAHIESARGPALNAVSSSSTRFRNCTIQGYSEKNEQIPHASSMQLHGGQPSVLLHLSYFVYPAQPGITFDVGITPGGYEIAKALSMATPRWTYEAAFNRVDIPNGIIYVTPSAPLPSNQWLILTLKTISNYPAVAVNMTARGLTEFDHCRILSSRAAEAMRLSAYIANNNLIRISHCRIGSCDSANASIVADAPYNEAPIYQCTLMGRLKNVSPSSGTSIGTNVYESKYLTFCTEYGPEDGTLILAITRSANAPEASWEINDGGVKIKQTGDCLNYTFNSSGSHEIVCKLNPNYITAIDAHSSKLTSIDNFEQCSSIAQIAAYGNANLEIDAADLPQGLIYASFEGCSRLTGSVANLPKSLTYASFGGCILLTGTLADLPKGLAYASFWGCSLLTGALADLPKSLTYASFGGCSLLMGSLADMPKSLTCASFGGCSLLSGALADLPKSLTYASFMGCPLLTGSIADLPNGLAHASFGNCSLLTGSNVAHMTRIEAIFLQNQQADQTRVNAIIDNCYSAKKSFSHPEILMNIGGSNAAPSKDRIARIEELVNNYNWTIIYS